MEQIKSKKITIQFFPRQLVYVDELQAKEGLKNRSETIRFCVEFYRAFEGMVATARYHAKSPTAKNKPLKAGLPPS